MQETRVQSLVWEDPTCHGATESARHNYRLHAGAQEPRRPLQKPTCPRARARQQEKPPQWGALHTARKSGPHSSQLEKSLSINEVPAQPKMDKIKLYIYGPFQVAQMAKNPPAMRETWVRSLDWEDLLEEGMATHSSTVAWRIPMDRGAWRATVHGVAKSLTWLSDWEHTHTYIYVYICYAVLSHVWLCATPWTVAHQAPLSMRILQARILEWVPMPSSTMCVYIYIFPHASEQRSLCATTTEPSSRNKKPRVPQLRPDTAKCINKQRY